MKIIALKILQIGVQVVSATVFVGFFLFSAPCHINAQSLSQNPVSGNSSVKQNRCLRTGQLIGAIGGSAMGLLHIYWSATGVSGIHGTFGKNLVTAAPSILLGAYVGSLAGRWMTEKILEDRPKPFKAFLKGTGYGMVAGAITLTTAFVPILLMGHYSGTIHFNLPKDYIFFRILWISMQGGALYGGLFGATAGAVYGPGVSLYMKF